MVMATLEKEVSVNKSIVIVVVVVIYPEQSCKKLKRKNLACKMFRTLLHFKRTKIPLIRNGLCGRFSRRFMVEPEQTKIPFEDNQNDSLVFCCSDASGDSTWNLGGSVAWVVRDSFGNPFVRGSKWYSGRIFSVNTDLLEMLAIFCLLSSIQKMNRVPPPALQIYSDNYKALKIIYSVSGYVNYGLSLQQMILMQKSTDVHMVLIANCISRLMLTRFHPVSSISKVKRDVNQCADALARYARYVAIDQEILIGSKCYTKQL